MKLLYTVMICLLGFANSSVFAQLTVSTTSIQNGAVNVGLNDTLWVTFSEKVSFYESPEESIKIPEIRFAFTPLMQKLSSPILVSEDSLSLGFPMQLTQRGPQQFVLWKAKSTTGSTLQEPLLIHFTTDSILAEGSVSGNVSVRDEGKDAAGTWVYLISTQFLYEGTVKNGALSASRITWVDNSEGNFSIPYVSQGSFVAFAFKHEELDQPFFMPNLMHGFADADGNSIPDFIWVGRKAAQPIEIEIGSLEFVYTSTAEHNQAVMEKAHAWNPDAAPLGIKSVGPVDAQGKSPVWEYVFAGSNPGEYLLMNYTGAEFWMIPVRAGDIRVMGVRNYIHSDSALKVAEFRKGADFRNQMDSVKTSVAMVSGTLFNAQLNKPVWAVTYFGLKDLEPARELVLLDALSGQPIVFESRTAYDAMNLVKAKLAEVPDSKPFLSAVNGFNLNPDGTAPIWTFDFVQPESREKFIFTVLSDGTVQMRQLRDSSAIHPIPIDSGWVNSPIVMNNTTLFKDVAENGEPILHLYLNYEMNRIPTDTVLLWNLKVIDRNNQRQPEVYQFDALTGEPYSIPVYTAFDGAAQSLEAAKTWDADAALVKVNSIPQLGVNTEGSAPVWQHWYQSKNLSNRLFIVSVSGETTFEREVVLDSTHTLPTFPVLMPLENLLNSTQIMALAEINGGSDYRAGTEFYPVDMNLDNVYVMPDSTLPVWMVHYPYLFDGKMKHAVVQFNAITGELFERPVRTSERNPFRIAFEAAKDWSKDASVRFALADSLDENGLVELWKFGFFSRSKQMGLIVEVQSGTTITAQYEVTAEVIAEQSTKDLPDWQESTEAFAKAEELVGKKYRDDSRLKAVKARIIPSDDEVVAKASYITSDNELAVWEITYELTDNTSEIVFVQGESVTTSIDTFADEIPETVRLEQNYPNPFNPTTTIGFSLNQRANVELTVYSILGQKVTSLVNQPLAAGSYTVQFNASNLASGTYLYQLKINNTPVQVRKLTLIK